MKFSLSIFFFYWSVSSFGQISQSKPFVLGKIETIHSSILNEQRILNIYLPFGYSPTDTISYPVVYLLDGSAEEDFIHVSGLYQFYSFPWIQRVPKSIVIGIANVDRKRDFTSASVIPEEINNYKTAGHSDKFISFIKNELQPFIIKNYKCSNDKTIIGESLGGLLATEILLYHPELFNRYIIVSPSLWWNDGAFIKETNNRLKNNIIPDKKVYFGVGKEGLAPSSIPHVMEVDINLLVDKLKGYKIQHLEVMFDYLPNENHGTIFHQAVLNSLSFIYKN